MYNLNNYEIETIIDGLQDAIRVCYDVDSTSNNNERSYPYATGYSREAMKTAVSSLIEIMKINAKYDLECM
jgi:hypothetical protein|tara:strand:+ start:2280 stop:2492 length:213 start_codon:yes stop_codon:yes gene_type:complete